MLHLAAYVFIKCVSGPFIEFELLTAVGGGGVRGGRSREKKVCLNSVIIEPGFEKKIFSDKNDYDESDLNIPVTVS